MYTSTSLKLLTYFLNNRVGGSEVLGGLKETNAPKE